MSRLLLLICSLLITQLSYAQFGETIRTGRPGKAIGAYSVGKNVFQVQSGFTRNNFSTDNPVIDIMRGDWIHTTVMRYGFTEKWEVSGVIGGRWDDSVQDGINNTQIGLRYNFFHNEGARPAIDLQGRLLLPWGSEELKREEMGARFIVGTGNSLGNNFSLLTNLGWTINQNAPDGKYYAVALFYKLSDRLKIFAEIYDNFTEFSALEVDFDTGLAVLINSDLLIDISTGWSGDNRLPVDIWFVDFGLSFRLHNRGSSDLN